MHEFVATLYEEHARELIAALALSTDDREAAQDLTHEVFIQALKNEEYLRGHPDPRAWLFRTGYNLARNRWRLLLRRRHRIPAHQPVLPTLAWDDLLGLRESLQKLSRRQRDVVVLHLYLGYSIEEIAGMLGVADGTIRSHLQRGRITLATLLNQEAGQ